MTGGPVIPDEGLRGARAYVALGSNLGDRLEQLRRATEAIDRSLGLRVLRASSVWETAPVGPAQPDYLNAVIEVDACRTPRGHLLRLLAIERSLGRERSAEVRWGPRRIDLDLLWQGGLQLRTETLVLPHPRLLERAFVLAPLAELAPGLEVGGVTVGEALQARPAEERASVRRWGPLFD